MTKEQYIEIKKKQKASAEKLRYYIPNLKEKSGIYIYTREDAEGKRFAYIGQAVNVEQRLVQHDMQFKQHLDKSLKKRGYYSKANPHGWKVAVTYYPKQYLDNMERSAISEMGKSYELYNVTGGGQDAGKVYIKPPAPRKGYREGKEFGRKQVIKELKHWVDGYLEIVPRKDNKSCAKALAKVKEILGEVEE